ncbi:hypothetical protein [Amycolatopsis australiensis]|uniref:Uncharacterized protein n=1 Tax=Amycolatopsis australiensis TaxID=546364 RepID=A0A1K1LLS1_9PSEU|nr:hypothetical protein [Amycolatopsis australiensis]SFW11836.1 hypothetical protein SAMN04489730_0063 [Amycolatopsis australiensis]
MPIHDIARDPVWADATFATDCWDDPAAPPVSTAGFIASLDFEPGLLTDTLHPFDGIADPQLLADMAAEAEAEVAALLGVPAEPPDAEVLGAGRFLERPEVTSWAA